MCVCTCLVPLHFFFFVHSWWGGADGICLGTLSEPMGTGLALPWSCLAPFLLVVYGRREHIDPSGRGGLLRELSSNKFWGLCHVLGMDTLNS